MAGPTAVGSKRIALIEDDEDIRRELDELLRHEGYSVVAFGDGLEAFRALKNGPAPDAIVLDLRVPGMDGWQFRIAQKEESLLSDVPVVAMSADGSAKARAIDAALFLPKPLTAKALIDAVRKVLDEAAVNRRRAAKLAFERMASLGTLAAGMAHEINNPLAYVTANLRLIAEQLPLYLVEATALAPKNDSRATRLAQVAREIDQMIAECLEGATRIGKIVQDVRTFSHLDDAQKVVIDPQLVLTSAIELAKNELCQRARLETHFGKIPHVLADEGRLAQAFVNLLVNAAQAMPVAGNDNVVTVTTSTTEDGEARIAITDTGKGISKEVQARIFEPFFTTKEVGEGTGLGLSICHGIVSALGGRITVESEVGRGSTFTILLPAAAVPSARAPAPPPLATPRRARILIVDDEPAIARVLARVLSRTHEVVVTTNGREAMELLANDRSFEVILCDLLMPDIAGMDLFADLSAQSPGMERRLVFMTGGAFTPSALEFVQRVPNILLEKPIDNEALFEAIRIRLEEADKERAS